MPVKILIKRRVHDDNLTELNKLLRTLRGVTLEQPGYVSGQTLHRIDQPNESMVISTWRSREDWENWVKNPERIAIQTEIDDLLGQETEYAMYE